MREIKFRAWDKEKKEMRQIQLMDWSDWWVSTGHTWERENALVYGERNSFKNQPTDRHIIMQYTGLKDKNNKDGYESDIIVTSVGKAIICFGEYSQSLGSQEYHMGYYLKFEFEELVDVYRKDIGFWLPQSKIIGNLYENPEMFNDT